jgi:hypothetical protein
MVSNFSTLQFPFLEMVCIIMIIYRGSDGEMVYRYIMIYFAFFRDPNVAWDAWDGWEASS